MLADLILDAGAAEAVPRVLADLILDAGAAEAVRRPRGRGSRRARGPAAARTHHQHRTGPPKEPYTPEKSPIFPEKKPYML